jgi:hypothetical protein
MKDPISVKGDFENRFYSLFGDPECAKLGFDGKDPSHSWIFWNHPSLSL